MNTRTLTDTVNDTIVSFTVSFLSPFCPGRERTSRRGGLTFWACAANDMVLIVLWTLAAVEDISYLSVMICFALFLVNDIYGYISWRKMERRQMA